MGGYPSSCWRLPISQVSTAWEHEVTSSCAHPDNWPLMIEQDPEVLSFVAISTREDSRTLPDYIIYLPFCPLPSRLLRSILTQLGSMQRGSRPPSFSEARRCSTSALVAIPHKSKYHFVLPKKPTS